jgi:GNAT superfamily N-acetyltransferase
VKRNTTNPAFTVRPWRPADDPALVAILRAHMEVDPGWPPAYARKGDLGEWLGAPATLGRWVAVDPRDEPVGHVGIAPVAPGEAAELWTGFLGCEIGALAEVCRNLVKPGMRRAGVSAALTRVALRAAIDAGRVPVATVLHDRRASLAMMLSAGWRSLGNVTGRSGRELRVMIPGSRVLEAALVGRAA